MRIAIVIAIAVMFVVPVQYYVTENATAATIQLNSQQLGFMTHINHIVFVVLENHAYDSYFGTYCQVVSSVCPYTANGISAGTCLPYNVKNLSGPCITPYNFTKANWTVGGVMPHGSYSSNVSWNKGKMNGFYQAEFSGLNPFGHYNGTTAPIVWDLAEEYSMDDNFYSSVMTYSLPNHWHIIAGQSPQEVYNGIVTNNIPAVKNITATIKAAHIYLNEANNTTSIEDRLLGSGVTWKYYEYTLGTYANAIKIGLNANKTLTVAGQAYNYWNPMAAKAETYNQSFVSHYVLNTQFYTDAKNGQLPALSWIIPAGQDSDHPPDSSAVAQGWLASIVDAVENSPEWNSTALYITWDDYGGFYDHVDPPLWQGNQLGFRVPIIEISAWTKKGFVAHQMNYFESVLRLMEWRFGLKCIAVLDCKSPSLPIWGYNWNLKKPNAPIIFPTNIANASYPFSPNWNGNVGLQTGTYMPPNEYTEFPDGQAPDID